MKLIIIFAGQASSQLTAGLQYKPPNPHILFIPKGLN